MNKTQRIVLGITLMLMGIITFVFVAYIWSTNGSEIASETFYAFCLLGIIFVGGGVFIMVSKKKR